MKVKKKKKKKKKNNNKKTSAQDLKKPFQTGSKQKKRHPVKKEETIYTLIVPQKIRANCSKMRGRSNMQTRGPRWPCIAHLITRQF